MKKSEFNKKIQEIDARNEVYRHERTSIEQIEQQYKSLVANKNRARSITVGTAFGGTAELIMRSENNDYIWCNMQPVEVVELIHQLAANVGCSADLKPRKDFASWRDWRVSEAEKKHLQGHAPFVNDMAVFQKLGASGYNDEEAQKIMDILASAKEFANENDNSKIVGQENLMQGAPQLMVGEDDKLLHNKVLVNSGEVLYMAGGNGGKPEGVPNENVATKKTVNKRKSK